MGRVKELWLDEQEKEFKRRVDDLILEGVNYENACEYVAEQMALEYDKRFGVDDQ